jgi:hypothetical protein
VSSNLKFTGALYFSPKLRSEKEFVLEALKQNTSAFYYASKEIKSDKTVLIEAVKKGNKDFTKYTEKINIKLKEILKESLPLCPV